MHNLELNDSILEIINDGKNLEFFHKNNYEIITISDFLKLPREKAKMFPDVIYTLENHSYKMDYALSQKQMSERNATREKIEQEKKKIRKDICLKDELERDITKIPDRVTSKVKKTLKENGIIKIEDILSLDIYQLCADNPGCIKLPYQFVKALDKYLKTRGLELSMINPITGKIKDIDDFKVEKIEIEEKIETSKDSEKKKANQKKWKDNWNRKLGIIKLFHYYHHHIMIPKGFKCDEIDLGAWLMTQRKKYSSGTLDSESIKALESLNIIWKNQKSGDGLRQKRKIMKEKRIKYIQLKNNEVSTIYENGEIVTTEDSDYRKDLAMILSGKTADEVIEERTKKRIDRKEKSTAIEKVPVRNANLYISEFGQISREEQEMIARVKKLQEKIELLKNEIYIEYKTKYSKMIELYKQSVQIDVLLEKNKENGNLEIKIRDYGILPPEDINILSIKEIKEKISSINSIITRLKLYIEISLIELEEKRRRKEEQIEYLRTLHDSLESELHEIEMTKKEKVGKKYGKRNN